MSPTTNQPNRDDLILQRLDQIHTELMQVRDDLKSDLRDYELKALHEKDIENLTRRDDDQEAHLQRLEERVLSQGQRYLMVISSVVGLLGGGFGLLHLFHIL